VVMTLVRELRLVSVRETMRLEYDATSIDNADDVQLRQLAAPPPSLVVPESSPCLFRRLEYGMPPHDGPVWILSNLTKPQVSLLLKVRWSNRAT
jgi:hypothetical protein